MEIRQKILHYTTTDEDLEDDMDSICKLGKPGLTLHICQKVAVFNGSTSMFWADMLKTVHPVVEDDMCFVMKKWKARGQELAGKKLEAACDQRDQIDHRAEQFSKQLWAKRLWKGKDRDGET